MKTDVLADALLCIADDVAQHGISCGTQHRAARDLLLSRSPRLRSGAFEAQPGESAAQFAVRNALRFRPDAVERALTSGRWTDDTLATYLHRWARETPDALAVAAPGQPPLTFAQARDRSERLAAALAAHGVGHGDVIAVQLPSIPWS